MSTIANVKETLELEVKNLNFYYKGSTNPSLKNINMPIAKNKITALIGPSGCGKTTLLRSFNRIHDLYPGNRYEGEILFEEGKTNILDKNIDLINLRLKIGMIFQKPTPFPMSIFDNVAYGLRLQGIKSRSELDGRVEAALKGAALWDEVSGRLNADGNSLSGGQQQRLCIARALAVNPDILLMDEPTSALDPISTSKIEELAMNLKDKYTIVIVTHNMQQAVRISDNTAFFLMGELIEYGNTEEIFEKPKEKKTEDYITGRFG